MQYQNLILELLKNESTESEYRWIDNQLNQKSKGLRLGFVMAHRHISSKAISSGELSVVHSAHSIDLSQWSRDQLCRTLLLLRLENENKENFSQEVETLFKTADNRESQALYAAIPLFNNPDVWEPRATEAIRSNVGLIFDAMAFNNPYPSLYFDEIAWNQLVLKTIFSDKSIHPIIGLKERRNENLARAISDFAHERWAAGRTLPADVWILTEPFSGNRFWQDTKRLLSSGESENRKAGYLLWKSHYSKAPDEIKKSFEKLYKELDQKKVEWNNLSSANQKGELSGTSP